jgi:hypothetical protein
MSNLINDLIPLFGKYQKDNVEDERLKLFLWMLSNDPTRKKKYLLHGDGISTWLDTSAKKAAFKSLASNETDPEVHVLINDFAKRIQDLNKDDVKLALTKLAGKDLDATAQFVLRGIFANINGNKATSKFTLPINDYTPNTEPAILKHFFDAPDLSAPTKEQRAFIDECHSRRPLAFSYQIDEYLARRILQDESTANISVGSTFLTDLDSKLAEPTHEFFRKPEDLSKLWTKDDKGVEVEVQRGSTKWRDVTKDRTDGECRGFKVTDVSGTPFTCSKYLEECLNGNDIDKCRNFMKSKEFWGNADGSAKTEVNGMLPSAALATLEKFGFRQVTVFDSVAKRNIFKVETVSAWLENLSKTIKDPDYSAIRKNENLIKYLTLLEVKINSSPEILNKGITVSEGTQVFNPSKFAGQYAAQVGIRAKLPIPPMAALHKRLTHTLNTSGVIGSPKFIIPVALNMRGGNGLVGGDISDYVSNMLIDENRDEKIISIEYENTYNAYKNALKGMNKTIDPADDKELQKLITSFKNTEKKIFVSMKLIKKYMELMDVFKNNDPRGVLTLSNLDLLVSTNKAQLEKGAKKQESLTNALNTLSSVVESATDSVKPASAGSFIGSSFSHEN